MNKMIALRESLFFTTALAIGLLASTSSGFAAAPDVPAVMPQGSVQRTLPAKSVDEDARRAELVSQIKRLPGVGGATVCVYLEEKRLNDRYLAKEAPIKGLERLRTFPAILYGVDLNHRSVKLAAVCTSKEWDALQRVYATYIPKNKSWLELAVRLLKEARKERGSIDDAVEARVISKSDIFLAWATEAFQTGNPAIYKAKFTRQEMWQLSSELVDQTGPRAVKIMLDYPWANPFVTGVFGVKPERKEIIEGEWQNFIKSAGRNSSKLAVMTPAAEELIALTPRSHDGCSIPDVRELFYQTMTKVLDSEESVDVALAKEVRLFKDALERLRVEEEAKLTEWVSKLGTGSVDRSRLPAGIRDRLRQNAENTVKSALPKIERFEKAWGLKFPAALKGHVEEVLGEVHKAARTHALKSDMESVKTRLMMPGHLLTPAELREFALGILRHAESLEGKPS